MKTFSLRPLLVLFAAAAGLLLLGTSLGSNGMAPDSGVATGAVATSRWTLRMEMPDAFYEDVTVRARLIVLNISGHALALRLPRDATDKLDEQYIDVNLSDSAGSRVPRIQYFISMHQTYSTRVLQPGDSLVGFSSITSLYQRSTERASPHPLRPGRYVAVATYGLIEIQGDTWESLRLASEPRLLTIARPPDSLREALSLLREARGIITADRYGNTVTISSNRVSDFYLPPSAALRLDSASVLLLRILEEYGNTGYGPEAALELRRRLSLMDLATFGLNRQDRDSIRAVLVATYPDDPFVDLYADGMWFGTKQQNRPVLLRVWSHAPAGSRLASILSRFQSDTK